MGRRTFKDRGKLIERVAEYYVGGRTMTSIAGTLHISVATVRNLLNEAYPVVNIHPRGRRKVTV